MSRQALGRGLESLIPLQGDTEGAPGAGAIAVDRIVPNPYQPRREFDPLELEELSRSIQEKGVVQPVLVRSLGEGQYELIAGERRLRAAKLAGLAQIPAVVREVDDSERLELALIENIQRSNLNAVEAARAYQQLMNQFSLTQDDVAKKVGKERSSVANTLRLLRLPEPVLKLLQDGRISEGHARTLLMLDDEELIQRLADKIQRDHLSVRDTERLVNGIRPSASEGKSRNGKKATLKDPHTRHLEEELRRKLGTQVKVMPKTAQKGKIEIEYYSLEDLDRIISLLG